MKGRGLGVGHVRGCPVFALRVRSRGCREELWSHTCEAEPAIASRNTAVRTHQSRGARRGAESRGGIILRVSRETRTLAEPSLPASRVSVQSSRVSEGSAGRLRDLDAGRPAVERSFLSRTRGRPNPCLWPTLVHAGPPQPAEHGSGRDRGRGPSRRARSRRQRSLNERPLAWLGSPRSSKTKPDLESATLHPYLPLRVVRVPYPTL
jgi:hypothetical protein